MHIYMLYSYCPKINLLFKTAISSSAKLSKGVTACLFPVMACVAFQVPQANW